MKPHTLKRREFLSKAGYGIGAACLGGGALLGGSGLARGLFRRDPLAPEALANAAWCSEPLPRKFTATETVTLGNTGIKTSRLAMGTGTVGVGHHSHQTALGVAGLSALLLNGYEQGLRFFDAADSYGSHPHVAAALKQVPRDKVTVLTKTWSRDAASARADLDRFRKELGTDYLDVCLMHCLTESDWTERYRGVMDVLSEAKQRGIIQQPRMFVSQHRSVARGGEIVVGGSRPGAHQSDRVAHGRQSRNGGGCAARNARGGEGHCRDEDYGAGRSARAPGRSGEICAVAWPTGRVHHWSGE